MADYFTLFNERRRPWIDPVELKPIFTTLASDVHPDRVHGRSEGQKAEAHRRFTDLNTGYNCLRDPRKRLAHLLELELGGKPGNVREIPADTMELFVKVGDACREADALLSQTALTVSPLLKVRLFEQAGLLTDRLQAVLRELNAEYERCVERMKALNHAWDSAPPVGSAERPAGLPCAELERVYHDVSYLTRWMEQSREKLARLAL